MKYYNCRGLSSTRTHTHTERIDEVEEPRPHRPGPLTVLKREETTAYNILGFSFCRFHSFLFFFLILDFPHFDFFLRTYNQTSQCTNHNYPGYSLTAPSNNNTPASRNSSLYGDIFVCIESDQCLFFSFSFSVTIIIGWPSFLLCCSEKSSHTRSAVCVLVPSKVY